MVRCGQGHENADTNAFCGTCGAALPATRDASPLPTSPPAPPVAPSGASDSAEGLASQGEAPGGQAPGAAPPDSPDGDPEGGGPVDGSSSRTGMVIGALVAVAAVVAGAAVVLAPSATDRYLEALEEEDLRGEFSTEVAAVRNAERVCEDLLDGGDAVGSPADEVGVRFLCEEFSDEFSVLRTETITGRFVLAESGGSTNVFRQMRDGDDCVGGTGGYSDIGPGTSVILSDLAGVPLERTSLGIGSVSGSTCEFEFDLEVTEGADAYVLAVGNRGESTFSFDEIIEPGAIALVLGR